MTTSRPSYYSSFISASSVVLISLCIRIVTSQQPPTPPVNVALTIGNSTTLQCSLGEPAYSMIWSFAVSGSSNGVRIVNWNTTSSKCTPAPAGSLYQVNASNTQQGQCDLIINNVSPSEAGWYLCSGSGSNNIINANAQVTVLYSNPVCSLNTTEVAVDDVVSMKCEVSYSNYGVNANMSWSGCSYQPLQTSTVPVGNITTTVSEIYTVANQQHLQTCICNTTTMNVSTSPPSNIAGAVSTSYERYSSQWYSPDTIEVQYCPDSVTLSPSINFLPLNTTISCMANGYPPPTYVLIMTELGNNLTETVVYESSIVLSNEGEYSVVCNATNFITSAQHGNYSCTKQSQKIVYNVSSSATIATALPLPTSVERETDWTTSGGFSNASTPTPTTTRVIPPAPTNDPTKTPLSVYIFPDWAIALIIVVPSVIGGGIVVIVCCCKSNCWCYKKFRVNKDKSPRQSLKESQNGRESSSPEFQMNQTSTSDSAPRSSREDSRPYPQQQRQMGAAYDNHAVDPSAVVYAELQQPQPQVDNRPGSRHPVHYQTDNTNEYSQVRIA